jgi:hypothetical protein
MKVAGVPLTSIMKPKTVQIGPVEQQTDALNGDWGTGGARLLLTDARVVSLLLDDARRRAVARMFGVPLDKTGLVTVIAVGTLAQALHDKAAPVLAGPALPSLGGAVFAGTTAKDVAHFIAGDWSRETPLFGSLVVVVVLGTLFRPVLRVSFRDVKASAHRARITFDHRYGHLVRRNRPHSPLPS